MQINHSSLLGKKEIVKRLTEKDKEKRIIVSPLLSSSQIQPASLDVRLGPDFLIIKIGKITHLDPLRAPESSKFEVERYTDKYKVLNKYERFILHPNEFLLGCTLEYIQLPIDIAARIEGRSSWGRLGIMVHSTAGFVDPGFCGNITFELNNMGKIPVPLYPGIRMAQLSFFEVDNDEKYEGKYLDSFGVIPSKYFEDYEFTEIRKTYSKESEDIVSEIFESVMNEGPCPQTKYPDRFPQELVEAIASAFKRHTDDYLET